MSTDRFLPPEIGRRDEPRPALRLYPLDQIAEMTGLSRDSLEREIRDGRLKPTRIRARIFVRSENLEAWLFRCEGAGESAAEKSGLCRVPIAFQSKQDRLAQARRMRTQARGIGRIR